MRRNLAFLSAVCLAATAISLCVGSVVLHRTRHAASSSAAPEAKPPSNRAAVLSSYARLPLSFEENLGQSDPAVKFLARGNGYTVFLTGNEAVLRLERPVPASALTGKLPPTLAEVRQSAKPENAVVRLSLKGANSAPKIAAGPAQEGVSNYLIGNDPTRWHRNVSHFASVKYHDVYPNIDLVYHGSQKQLEQDFVLAPGADPNQIDLSISGAGTLSVNSLGDLVLATSFGNLLLQRPTAYQVVDGKAVTVAANFVPRNSSRVGFQVAAYDHNLPLIIDPVLAYATYLGGSGSDYASGIAADSSGNAYITGATSSADFPVTSGALIKNMPSVKGNAFVTKLNPSGSALIFSTYLGGSGDHGAVPSGQSDAGSGIAVDAVGNIYVGGSSGSSDFPVTSSAYQKVLLGVSTAAFVAKLDPTGSTVLYATFLGGNGGEYCYAFTADALGNMYVTGVTSSTTYPITVGTAIQTTNNSGETLFISRVDPTQIGTGSLVFSTYLGGTGTDIGWGIAVDNLANVYVTGQTASKDFPVRNAYQAAFKGVGANNAFLATVNTNPNTAALIYSTYLSGTTTTNLSDIGNAVDVGGAFTAYVAGSAASADFPTTPGAFQTVSKNGNSSGFVTKFDTSKSGAASLVFSTFLGGSNTDTASAIKVDASKNVFVGGDTASSDFPVTFGAPQPMIRSNGGYNAFLSEFNPAGSGLLFSTYLGGQTGDFTHALALDTPAAPNVYMAGSTISNNFPTTSGAFQTAQKGSGSHLSAFVAKMSPAATQGVFALPATLAFGTVPQHTASTPQVVTVTNNTNSPISAIAISFTGTNASDFGQTTTCGATLASGANCTISVTFTPSTTADETATLQVADSDAGSPHLVALSGSGSVPGQPDFSLTLTPALDTLTAGGTASFSVTATSISSFAAAVSLGCSGAPQASTCTFLPTSITPPANSSMSSAGTITTTARAVLVPRGTPRGPSPLLWLGILLSLALALFALRMVAQQTARRLIWAGALLSLVALAGCSGLKQNTLIGTPAGTYTLTVTATSGAVSHSSSFVLTVN